MATPKGIILLWHDDVSTIPDGWVICDGNNDTPDLRGYFAYGASLDTDVNVISGSDAHTHSSLPSLNAGGEHTHSRSSNTAVSSGGAAGSGAAGAYSKATPHTHSYSATAASGGGHTHTISGTSGSASSRPPYLKLFYIMKT